MSNRAVKLIGLLLVPLMIFYALLLINSELKLALYVLLSCVLLLFSIILLFLVELKKLKKTNAGIAFVLEKSEESRATAEKLKDKILLIINDLPEGILIVDKDDKVSIINSRAEKFLDVNKKQILNKPVLELGHLSNFKKVVIPLLINFKGGATGHLKEEIKVRKNLILDLTIEPLVLDKNNVAKLIILDDITKIKYAEAVKGRFISVTAHQLKAPLSTVRMSLKMLLDRDFGKINKEQQDILEKTYKKNESLIYLVEDLLKEEKVNEIEQAEDKSLINLEDSITSVIDFYRDAMKRKKINFKFNKPGEKLPEILADPEKIKIVIQNLFDNAVKYTPLKGKIEVAVTYKKGQVEFEIKDSGLGIPESQKEKIFTRFFRAANVAKVKTAGSGLGLAIAKEIIEKYHGKIWFQSKENRGSTFFFSLPFTKN